jgi:hypothetical protein
VFTVDASGNGFYAGNLNVTGKITAGTKDFKIDDALDPDNKYLYHAFRRVLRDDEHLQRQREAGSQRRGLVSSSRVVRGAER